MAKLGNDLNDLVKFHSDKMLSDNTECITYYHARRIQMRQNTRGTNPGYRLLGHTDTETKKPIIRESVWKICSNHTA